MSILSVRIPRPVSGQAFRIFGFQNLVILFEKVRENENLVLALNLHFLFWSRLAHSIRYQLGGTCSGAGLPKEASSVLNKPLRGKRILRKIEAS
jgi:hypothetical protein